MINNTPYTIYSVPGGQVNILGDHTIGHSKQKLYIHMSHIPNGFRYRAITVYSGLDLEPHIVFPSRRTAPLFEACELV
jgi:hypothetical protein